MKNVRLFAVAAALGMFASTVAAAETTKTVTWSGDDTVIKVDLGEKLVVTAPTASIKIEGTEAECQNGTDANGDGLVDAAVYGLNPEVFENGWFPSTTLWASTEDAVKALTLGGARYLTPGEAEVEEETYVDVATGITYYSNEDFFNALVKKGEVKVSYNEDGDIATAMIRHYNTYSTAAKTYKTGEVWTTVYTEGKKKSDAAIMEAVINNLVSGTKISNTTEYTVDTYENPVFDVNKGGVSTYSVVVNSVKGGHTVTKAQPYYVAYQEAPIVTVSYSNRKGYAFENVKFENVKAGTTTNSVIGGESRYDYVATGSDLKVKEDIVAGNVYIDANGDYTFTTGDLVWVEKTSKDTDKIYSKTHLYATGTDLVDGIVIRNTDAYGFYQDTVVDYTTADITVKYKGTWTKVTAKNAKTLWTVANLADGNVIINGTQIDKFSASLTKDTAGVALITELETPFDYVSGGMGLNVTTKRNAEFWTTATYAAYGAFIDVKKPVYEAVKNPNEDFNSLTRLGKAGYITVVDVTDAEEIYSENDKKEKTYDVDGVSVVAQYPIETFEDGAQAMNYYLSIDEDGELVFGSSIQDVDKKLDQTNTDAVTGSYLAYGEVSENTSDKYVLLVNNTAIGFKDVAFSYNSNKETGVLYTYDNEVIECSAVELDDDKWYPAFDSEEELLDAVAKLAGVDVALEGNAKKAGTSFYKWYAANAKTNPAVAPYLPTTANYVGTSAEACDYTVSSTSDKVTVTATNTVDTNKAGVYELEYAATYEGEVVDTTSIKVVVAPNYTRTWENGRVKTLTSYYVSNPTAKYAEYNYNWAAGTATVTYYTVDGAVADTATVEL